VSKHTIYACKQKYGGLEVAEAQEWKHLREENSKLKKLVADYALDKEAIKSVNRKKRVQLVGAMAQLTVARADVEQIRGTLPEMSERHACGLALIAVSSYRYPRRKVAKDAGLREQLTLLASALPRRSHDLRGAFLEILRPPRHARCED
jgi:hypothetical protein